MVPFLKPSPDLNERVGWLLEDSLLLAEYRIAPVLYKPLYVAGGKKKSCEDGA
jgi:hypothetical protein